MKHFWYISSSISVLLTLTCHGAAQDEPGGVTPMQRGLHAQLYDYEEELNLRLSRVYTSCRRARELLRQQVSGLTRFNHDVELVAIRFEQIRDTLQKSAAPLAAEHATYGILLCGFAAARLPPRVHKEWVERKMETIHKPLEAIAHPTKGSVKRTIQSLEECLHVLQKNRTPDKKAVRAAVEQLDELVEQLEIVVRMTEGATICGDFRLMFLERAEERQRRVAGTWELVLSELLRHGDDGIPVPRIK